MKVLLRVLSVFLIVLIFTSLFGSEYVHAAPEIMDFWIDASSANAKSYTDGRLANDMIRWWRHHDNGRYYIMMPNSANLSKLKVFYNATNTITVNGKNLISGSETDIFKNGGEFVLNCGGKSYILVIMKASKIPSMFISTDTGSLRSVHANKDYRESGLMLLVDENGSVVYNDDLDHIKGRGNATWFDYPKKPYNIRLSKSTDLLGMGKSKRWSLIANWVDKTHMHNKLAYDIAQEVGIEFAANTRHVDLYINNEYQGLYVLTERNNVEENHVNITDLEELTEKANNVTDLSTFRQRGTNHFEKNTYKYFDIPKDPDDITGGYLIEFELSGRYSNEPSGFVTSRGQAIVIKSPEFATKKQVEYIRNFYQELEDAVYSPTGYNSKGKHYSDYIDEDSLVRMYVLQEYCLNLDVAICSFFLYKESDKVGDGKLHAAPPWDFDNAFGLPGTRDNVNLSDPLVWWANKGRIHNDPDWTPHLLTAVYKHKRFAQKAVRIYHTEFVPIINKIIYPTNNNPTKIVQKMEAYRDAIRDSAVMNNIFWYNSSNTIDQRISNLTSFMRTRATFLAQNWKTNINDLDIENIDPVVYKGSPVKPKVVIKDMGDVLEEGNEYQVEYKNNNSVGKASITITMQKYYTGTKTVSFTIVDQSKAALVDAINLAKSKSQKEYSSADWNILQSKLKTARDVCEKTNASKSEIDKATNELILAVKAGNADKSNLQDTISLAESKNASDYTQESWNRMQSVLSNAKAVLNNLHATQSDIDSVTTELLNSINALEPATGGGEETPGPSQSGNKETATPGGGSPKVTTSSPGGNGDDEPAITHENKNQTLKYIILIIIGLVFIAEIVIVTVFLTKKKKSGK